MALNIQLLAIDVEEKTNITHKLAVEYKKIKSWNDSVDDSSIIVMKSSLLIIFEL
jgi:hypothetical protein